MRILKAAALPRRIQEEAPDQHPFRKVEAFPTESAFGFMSRYCFLTAISPAEAQKTFGIKRLQASLAGMWAPEGTDLTPHFSSFFDLDMESAFPKQWKYICGQLRYCERCWSYGAHCILFQHWALEKCPLHGCTLRQTCVECDKPLDASLSACLSHPYECTSCGHQFLTRFNSLNADVEAIVSLSMFKERLRELIWKKDNIRQSSLTVPASLDTRWGRNFNVVGAVRSREVRRQVIWSEMPSTLWMWRFKEIEMRLNDWSEKPSTQWPRADCIVEQVGTETLKWLVDLCDFCHEDSVVLRAGLRLDPRYLYIDADVNVVAIALHSVMCAFGRIHEPPVSPDEHAYEDIRFDRRRNCVPLWQSAEAAALIVHFEILGAFAAALIEASKFTFTREICWPFMPSGLSYQPTWVILQEGGYAPRIRCRPRADRRLVVRMLLRFRKRRLQGRHVLSAWATWAR